MYTKACCAICQGSLIVRMDEKPLMATVVASEGTKQVNTARKECTQWLCRATHRCNFAFMDGEKVNALSFRDLEKEGMYFVTKNFGFTMTYLKMSLYRFLRGNLAPGQEATVRQLVQEEEDALPHPQRFASDLLRALEGYALAARTPHEVVSFPIDNPSSHLRLSHDAFLFPPPVSVTALAFDGHFGVHRRLHMDYEEPRSVRTRGRPKSKTYCKDHRTCTCANKEKQRVPLRNRTAGWQFVLDPRSRRVLAAQEHIVNELTSDKAAVVHSALKMPKVNPDLLIHDDACHFEAYIKKSKVYKKAFRKVKHYIIDEFHRPNHKCKKRNLTLSEKKRAKHVRTNMAETFNCWIRRKNFALNSMAPHSHRFWVCESIRFWNANLKTLPMTHVRRRSTAETRKRPAARN